jgi:hypothetical protein
MDDSKAAVIASARDPLGGKIRRGVFNSVAELEEAIRRLIRDHNGQAKPFVWTKTAEVIFEKLSRLPALCGRQRQHRRLCTWCENAQLDDAGAGLLRLRPHRRAKRHHLCRGTAIRYRVRARRADTDEFRHYD